MADDRTNAPDSPSATNDVGSAPTVLNAAGVETLTVPHGPMLLNANFARSGSELQLTGQAGEQVVVQNFFGSEMAPVLMTEGGGKIMADVAESLAGPDLLGGGEGDATLMGQSDQPIGTVDTAEGGVFAVRADGTRVELNEGDPVFQGDVLETDDEGAVSLTFVDNTEFALDQGARMVLDEMVFDAQSGEGSSTFTVVQGVFTFVSGQVAKSGSDAMTVNTPVATIGIRGTKVAIKAGSEDEDTVITLLQEDSGHIGEIAVTNDAGTQVMNQANQTTFIQSASVAPTQPAILPSEQLRSIFTENSTDTRGLWRYEEGEENRTDDATLEETIEEAKEAAVEEGTDEETVENAEAAAELAFELALAEGEDEEAALELAAEAFQNALIDENAADSLIETAAGGDDFGGPLGPDGNTGSVFDYNPDAGFGGADPGPGTTGGATFGGPGGDLPEGETEGPFDPVIRGGDEDDTLTGTDGADEFVAGGGDDLVFAGAGDDTVDAGAGNDTVYGGAGDDTIDGGAGNDTLYGDGDDDTISGGAGNDTIFGNDGDDEIEGGEGNDIAFGGAGSDDINMGDGDDFIGTSGDDGSDDDYDGGAGNDTVSFATDVEGVTVNMDEDDNAEFDIDANTARGDDTGEDTIEGIENVTTGSGDDVIIGQTGEANVIDAGAGDDLVIGGEDDDLVGGAGVDTLRISMTRDEFESSEFQAEVAAYRADPSTPFHFDSINMDVESFEQLQIEVDGTIIVAEPPTLEVGDVFGAEDTAILLGVGASLNDTDGAESLEVEIGGLPEGSTLHYIDGNGVAQSIEITEGDGTVIISGETQAVLDTLAVTPPEGDSGDFAIEVTATAVELDGSVSSVSDSFNVIVNGIPSALPESVSGDEDAGVLTGNLTDQIGGDGTIDPDSDDLAFSIDGVTPDANGDYVVSSPEGTLTLHADGSYEFAIDSSLQGLDDGESAVAQFTFTATDNGQPILSDDNTLTVTVTGSNDGPVAEVALIEGTEDSSVLTGNLEASDLDGDTLTFGIQGSTPDANGVTTVDVEGSVDGSTVTIGQLVVQPDGSYAFTPDNDALQGLNVGDAVTANFAFTASDGTETTSAVLEITLTGTDDGLVALAETVEGGEDDGTLTGNLEATDADSENLTFGLAAGEDGEGQYGSLTVNADGSYSFDIAEAAQALDDGETVIETFTYQVTSDDETTTETVTVTITGSNDGPVASAETVSGGEDAATLTGNLDATDIEGDDLTFSLQSNGEGQYGTLSVNPDGSYSFDIAEAAQGLDDGESAVETFTYEVTDGDVTTTETVTITITGSNDGPVASAETVAGGEDAGTLTGNLDATDVDGDDLTFSLQGDGEGQYGTLTVNPDGSYSFDIADAAQGLDDGESAVETFTYEVTDGDVTTTETVTVTITGSNDGPVASAETVAGGEDAGTLTGNLDATDINGDDLTFSLQGDGEGQYGTLSVNPDGSYSFDIAEAAQGLDDGESAVETFTYEVTDGDVTTTETVTVTITGSNDGPIASAETVSGGEDAGTLTGNLDATDVDGDDLTFSLQGDGEGQYGTLSVNPDGSYSFDIAEAAQGLDDGESAVETFTYEVTDGDVTTTETVTVKITGSNDGPVAEAESVSGGEDAGTLTGNLDATDIDGDDLTFSLQGDGEGTYGNLTVNADGSYSFDIAEAAQGLDDGESAVETFTYEVTDGDVTTTETVTVTITGSNDGPVASAETVSGGEDAGTLTGNLDATDIDGDDLTFSLQGDGEGQYGTLSVNPDGSYSFDIADAAQGLDDGESAVETFTYEVTDGDVTTTETVTVTITGSNDGPIASAETVAGGEDAGTLTGNLDATDIDGDDLTFSLQGDGEGQYGNLTVNPDGSYSFDIADAAQGLDDGESAVETFTYEVTDGDVTTTETVTVTITGSNDGPVASAETVAGGEDAGTLTGNLDATDIESDDLTFSLQSNGEGQYGTLSVNPDGSYSFDIAEAAQGLDDGESAVETFTYDVTDGDVTTTETVTVTITGSNDGPVASAETVSGGEDAGTLTGNLDATDIDGDDLTFSLQGDGEGQYGTLSVNPDGSYSFDIADAAQGLDDGESAVETFTYEVTDGDVTTTETVTVTITGSNDGPVASAETVSGGEDAGTLTGNLDATDIDGDDLTFSLQGNGEGQYGTLSVNTDGSYSFDIAEAAQGLDDGESAVETFTYEVTDGDVTTTETITVTITGSNDGPLASAETVSGGEDAGTLTGNLDATDIDGDDLTFSLQGDGEGQYGSLTVNPDGSYSFDIADAAQGLDDGESAVETFTYEVTDGDVTTTETVTVTITGSNDGPVASAETVAGGEDAGTLTGNLDATDIDGDDLTFSLQGDGEGTYGNLTVNADGSYSFDIAEAAQGLDDGESAVETFTYEVTDGDVTTTETITVKVTGSNDGPVASAETVAGGEDAGTLTGNLDATDVDGDDLTFSLQGDGEGQYGTLSVNPDGSYSFDIADAAQGLDDGESAVETFTYEVTDGDVTTTETITVTITGSNDGPVAVAESVSGGEDAGSLTGNLDATDIDGDDLTFSLQGDGEGQYGTLSVNPDGSYSFDIADAAQGLDDGESAVETFTYEVTDGDVTTTETVTVTITGSNDGPVASAETVAGGEDAGTLTGNLDATDVDGDDLTFSLQGDGEGTYGNLTVNPDGSYSFDIADAAQGLDDGESAVETFTYEVTDGDVTTTETVTVTITGSNDGPVASAETVAGSEDAGTLTGNLDATDIDGDDLTFSLQGDGEGQYGTLSVNPDGSYSFDIAEAAQGLDDGESAVETFTYEVTDGDVTTTETVTVTITGSNDGPVASAETVSGGEDAGTLTGNLDATDVDGDDLTFSLQGDGEGQYGTLSVNPDGSYSFDIADAAQGLDDGESAVETFTYEVTDGDVTTTETVTVKITGSNDGPVASAETVSGGEDAGTLTGNLDATDVDGDDLTFSLQGDGVSDNGTLTVNPDGSYSFDIADAAQGLDDGESAVETFTYEVTDGDVTTTETVTVTITGSNDGPVASAETVSGGEDAGTLTGNLDATDVDGDDLTFSLQGDGEGQYGNLTVNADGSYSFDIAEAAQGLDDGESAVETFTYEVTDGDVTTTETVTVTITGSNDGPVASAETVAGGEDAGTLTGNLDATDVDGDDLTFSLQGDGVSDNGTLTVNPDGSYSFDIADAAQGLDDGESAVETFTYEVTDGDVTTTETVTVTITGSNDGPVASAETVSGSEDAGTLTGNLDATDIDGDDLTFSLQGNGEGQYGTLSVNPDGSYSFNIAEAAQGLDDGESAVETFTYEVTDGDVTTTQTIQVTVTGSNDAPVAEAESVSGQADDGQLTGNLDATDVDGDDLTFSLQGSGEGQYGDLTVNPDGSYTFDIGDAAQNLANGESVVETFTYEVTDGDVTTTQTISVTVSGSNNAPVATPEFVSGHEDDGVITGNSGPGETTVTATFVGEEAGYKNIVGSYQVDADGNITDVQFVWTNASLQGSGGTMQSGDQESFETSDTGEFGLFLVADGYSQNGGLANFDLENGSLEFRNSDGTPATVESVNPQLFYVDQNGQAVPVNGPTYHSASADLNPDGKLHTSLETDDDGNVTVGWEDLPSLGDHDYDDVIMTLDLGESGGVLVDPGYTGGDDNEVLVGQLDAIDADGDDLTFDLAEGEDGVGEYGTLVVNPDGTYAFTLNANAQTLDDGEEGVETFTWQVTDGAAVTTESITITVTGSNDGPVATAEIVSGGEDAGTLTGNLDATDVEGDDLTFSLQGDGEGQYGTLSVNSDGSYSFDIGEAAQGLDEGESAVETFTYEVTDGDVTTTETVTVTIQGSNDGPIASAEAVVGSEDAGTLTGNLDATDIDGDDLTFSLQGNGEGQYGDLTVNANGTYSFAIGAAAQALDDGESAVETFTYEVTDGDVTTTETVTVTIQGSNDGPVAAAETVSGGEDAGTLTGNLEATDIEGDDLTFSLQGDGEGQYGDLTVNADGSYSFDIGSAAQGLDDGESAVEVFTYEVTDGDVVSTNTVSVTITASNDGPVAQAEAVSGSEDAGTLTGNLDAFDVDGDELTFSLQGSGEGTYGTLSVNANGSYSFAIGDAAQALEEGESVVETFTYEVTDGDETSTQSVSVTITGASEGNFIVGTECHDYLVGTSGADNISGLGGNDWIWAGDGDDIVDGGDGHDAIGGGGGNDIIDGGDGHDAVWGGSGNDTLTGGAGNDYLTGQDGNDALYGGDGNDKLYGGDGNDTLNGGAGDDRIKGGTGDDAISAGSGDDRIHGGSGDDVIEGGFGEDDIDGGSGNDIIYGDTASYDGPDYSAVVNEHGPVAFWRLDDTNGTTATDETGNHDGTYEGGVEIGEAGAVGDSAGAAVFDGRNDHVEVPHDAAFEAESGTVMMWVRPDDLGGDQGLFSKDSKNYDDGGHLHIELDGSKVKVRLQGRENENEDFSSHTVESPSGTAQEGQWMQVAFTWGATGMALYVNGTLVDTDSFTGGIEDNQEPIVMGASQTHSGDQSTSGLREFFEGAMDEVAFFDTALSDEAIADTFTAGSWNLGSDDEIEAGSGDDVVYGGAGDDEIEGESGDDELHGGAGEDDIDGGSGHDTIYGDAGDDKIEGGSGDDTIYGGEGDDEIDGGLGDDIIIGGDGADILDGGSGENIFMYNAASEGGDTVVGFDSDKDMFQFDGDDFGGFGNYTVQNDGSDFKIIGEDGSEIGFDDDSNTLFYRSGDDAGEGYQTIATVSGDDVTSDDIEII